MKQSVRFMPADLSRLIPLLAVVMEVLWSYAWLIWLSSWPTFAWPGPPLNLVSCLVLTLGVETLARFSTSRAWSLQRARWIVLVSSLVLLFVLLRWNLHGGYNLWGGGWIDYAADNLSAVLIGFFFGLYLIWRGISLGRQRFGFSEVYQKFLIGLTAIIILLIIWGITGAQMRNTWSSAGAYAVAYFGAGLLTVAITNLEALRSQLSRHQEAARAFTRRWLSMLVILILIILGISGALAGLFSSSGVQRLFHILSVLGNWLLTGLYYVLWPLGYLLEGLIFVLRWLISLLRGEQTPPQFNLPDLSDLQKAGQGQSPVHIPEGLILALKWGGLALVTGLIIFFLARALTKYWEGKNEEDIEEVHETIGSWSTFMADLKSFLARLFRRFRRRRQALERGVPASPPAATVEQETDRVFNIRELYQALLWQGRQLGAARRQAETPYEYARKLETRLNLPADEINALTEAYVTDRYGLVNPTPAKVTLLNRIWRTLAGKLERPAH